MISQSMNGPQKWIVSGTGILLVSLVTGVGGTAWFIHKSFDSLRFNETAGIGAVGGALFEALLVTVVVGFIGSLAGILIVIVGVVKGRKLP